MKLTSKLMILASSALILFLFFYYTQLSDYFTVQKLQENHHCLAEFVKNNYLLSVVLYIAIYSLLLACGMPVVMPLAIIGGFLYGIIPGILYAAISCLLGSVISFLVLRYVIMHWIRDWYTDRLITFNKQINKYGYSYLVILHFLSVVPMFVINLLAALANVPLRAVIWITLVGTFPLNALCVFAGRKLSSIQSYKDIFSPTIMILLALLSLIALVPLLIKKIKESWSV